MKVYWFIPSSHMDETYLGSPIEAVPINYEYLGKLARTLEDNGYTGALVATGKVWEDAWVVASSLLGYTTKLKFLVAIRPGIMSPTLAARMSATFDRLSGGRLLVNVVTGGDKIELAGDGLYLEHDERYALTDEFIDVWKKILGGDTVSLDGEHVKVTDAHLLYPPVQKPYPPLYFGGSSEAAMQVAAKHIDVYLTWGEAPSEVAQKIGRMRRLAAEQGRKLEFGIRLHLIVRETDEEAWEAAEQLIQYLDEGTIAAAQQKIQQLDSVGQQRMSHLHDGDRNSLIVGPNLWAGIGLVRGGAGTALVGSPRSIAKRIHEYAELGIEHFIFSGYPHLNESIRVANLLFPFLPLKASETAYLRGRGDVASQ